MPTHPNRGMVDGQPTFDITLPEIAAECGAGGALRSMPSLEYISYRQCCWWKGVLLPALSEDSGDSKHSWETRLKLKVMPDKFQPEIVVVGASALATIPSITKLSKTRMSELIDGSVQQLHEWGLDWVTGPDETLRSK